MPSSLEVPVEAAEQAIFARKKLLLDAAAGSRLPGRFETFGIGGLRASMATSDHYEFLNTIEGVTEQSAEALSDVVERFPAPCRITVVATAPTQKLSGWLRGQGYEPAPARPLAILPLSHAYSRAEMGATPWRIGQVFGQEETTRFLEVLERGYAASDQLGALIRTEAALPAILRFTASRNGIPFAAGAMSLHATCAVLGGASTLPAARRTGAQSALLACRLSHAVQLGAALATATAAPGSPSLSNLNRLGFTIVERTAWRLSTG